jgi:basic amino acid/polyamine antiporter, APA family
VILVDIVTMSRIGFAMARDGLLPPRLAHLHPRFGTPSTITLVTVAIVAALAAFVPLADLAEMVSIGTLFAFTIVSLAVPVLRRTRPTLHRPFRTPLVPLLPVVSAILCVALMANLAIETWLRFLVWLAVGLVVYFGYGARSSRRTRGAAVSAGH